MTRARLALVASKLITFLTSCAGACHFLGADSRGRRRACLAAHATSVAHTRAASLEGRRQVSLGEAESWPAARFGQFFILSQAANFRPSEFARIKELSPPAPPKESRNSLGPGRAESILGPGQRQGERAPQARGARERCWPGGVSTARVWPLAALNLRLSRTKRAAPTLSQDELGRERTSIKLAAAAAERVQQRRWRHSWPGAGGQTIGRSLVF